jgi:hypothetical protein
VLNGTICYLAGGSYHAIHATVFISKPSIYYIMWHTIDCINKSPAFDVKLPGIDELNYIREEFKRNSLVE